jgi:hypothetical protein
MYNFLFIIISLYSLIKILYINYCFINFIIFNQNRMSYLITNNYNFIFKVILTGNPNVGKSNTFLRFFRGKF